jgi:hypothetical protein
MGTGDIHVKILFWRFEIEIKMHDMFDQQPDDSNVQTF